MDVITCPCWDGVQSNPVSIRGIRRLWGCLIPIAARSKLIFNAFYEFSNKQLKLQLFLFHQFGDLFGDLIGLFELHDIVYTGFPIDNLALLGVWTFAITAVT